MHLWQNSQEVQPSKLLDHQRIKDSRWSLSPLCFVIAVLKPPEIGAPCLSLQTEQASPDGKNHNMTFLVWLQNRRRLNWRIRGSVLQRHKTDFRVALVNWLVRFTEQNLAWKGLRTYKKYGNRWTPSVSWGKKRVVAIFELWKTAGIAPLCWESSCADNAQILKVIDDHRSVFLD